MARFWVYIGDKIQGPVDIPSLRKVPGFNLLTQVCPEGEETWRIADEVIEIKSYFLSPPRPNSFAVSAGNTAPNLDAPPKVEFSPLPELEELTLPEPNTSWQNLAADPKKIEAAAAPAGQTGPGAALRAVCDVCGYKNPRDVTLCMKCGEILKGVSSKPAVPGPTPAVSLPAPNPVLTPARATTPAPVAADSNSGSGATVEISVSKLVACIAAASAVALTSFFGIRSWKKHHTARPAQAVRTVSKVPSPAYGERASAARVRGSSKQRPPHLHPLPPRGAREVISEPRSAAEADAMPGMSKESASYRVLAEATPRQKRFSSPANSPYAVKRRADTSLWTSQEEQAIRQVQQNRIYGGQRTIGRNAEILMQILRDREYTTAFESGKRIYLYNDLDWSASMKEGPVYEVRLSFSGGREPDGSVKKPLHFAFVSDLERGTVEGGGEDQIRSNTLHAFFDESRIPPEDRRAIAKDAEELVMAAQPGASPLALDTVVRQFAKVYTTASLARVADAYDLALVKKRLAHDPRLGTDEPAEGAPSTEAKPYMPAPKTPAAKPEVKVQKAEVLPVSKGGPAEFRMENGAGRERTVMVRAASKASVNKIWEVLTGYDRLKQFMPDMIASEREGQDGAAVIVHTACLTRYAFFVYKVNLHLRVIEHPREHSLEFERIAGDFESFRGSIELTTDPATHDSQIAFHATVVPSGHVMSGVLETKARRLLIPQVEALRAKAESN